MMFLVLSMMIGCKKTRKGADTGKAKEGKEIAPASTTSQLRLVEVLPSVVDVGVRTEATVMVWDLLNTQRFILMTRSL